MYTIIVYSQKTMFADLLVKEIKEYFILNEFNIKKEISFSVYSDIIQLEQINMMKSLTIMLQTKRTGSTVYKTEGKMECK